MKRNKGEIELSYIYTVLGKLRSIVPTTTDQLGIKRSIFPKRFVYKLINDRLNESAELAVNLATVLFRRLNSEYEQRIGELIDATARQRSADSNADNDVVTTCPELDEFFHCTLCNVHDFLISLDWHEPILEDSPKKSDDNYIKSNLPYLNELIQFRKLLVDTNTLKMVASAKTPESNIVRVKSNVPSSLNVLPSTVNVPSIVSVPSSVNSPKVLRSSLSTKRSPESPGPRRRVRFNDSVKPTTGVSKDNPRVRKYIKDSHSILALDLTLFSLHMFVIELKKQLLEWSSESATSMKESMQLILNSRRKIRVNRLISMAKDREVSNAVHANILNILTELERIYLLEHVLGTVCAHDEQRLRTMYKQPHVRIFVNEFLRIDQKEVLDLMVAQVLELLFELAICEINIPPMELANNSRNKNTKEDGIRKTGQENYLNLVTSWLNLDKILFGSKTLPKTAIKEAENTMTGKLEDNSSRADFAFKSSSRILNQMENLHELMRHILADLLQQINSKLAIEYFLHLLHRGMGYCLELIATRLEIHLSLIRKTLLAQQKQALKNGEQLNPFNIDRIAIKIRYLKLIHISSSMDNLVKELSQMAAIDTTAITTADDSPSTSNRVSQLIDQATKEMESI